MDTLRQYILSVTAAAILCGVLRDLIPEKGAAGQLLKLISGIFLAFAAISPVKELEIPNLQAYMDVFSAQGEVFSDQGKDLSADAMAGIIKDRSEAYILDKAGVLAAEISVEVELTDDPLPAPAAVRIYGSVSPYARAALETMIETELGIPKEDQIWIGQT